ncbi:hypothetical protein IEQ34_007352 [Dendrobium chrysotoxum]|uniref:Uncharacterized protein n=1 Tax=Dendrobium chrysotoxum TaxID=161865 RepID=A0AAV7H620_DENCH|nr:hypothetical protein IEQ34_007352 [Dendrobium chrysotoxum]
MQPLRKTRKKTVQSVSQRCGASLGPEIFVLHRCKAISIPLWCSALYHSALGRSETNRRVARLEEESELGLVEGGVTVRLGWQYGWVGFKHRDIHNLYLFYNRRALDLCNFADASIVSMENLLSVRSQNPTTNIAIARGRTTASAGSPKIPPISAACPISRTDNAMTTAPPIMKGRRRPNLLAHRSLMTPTRGCTKSPESGPQSHTKLANECGIPSSCTESCRAHPNCTPLATTVTCKSSRSGTLASSRGGGGGGGGSGGLDFLLRSLPLVVATSAADERDDRGRLLAGGGCVPVNSCGGSLIPPILGGRWRLQQSAV